MVDTTYVDDGRVLGHGRRLVLLDARVFFDPQVFDIAAAENDVVVNLVGRRYLIFRPTPSALCSVGADILERHGRLVRVDLVEDADISRGDEQGDWGATWTSSKSLPNVAF